MKTGSESNIPRESVPEQSMRNYKSSYDLALVPSETSAATLYLEYVTREHSFQNGLQAELMIESGKVT